MLILWAEGAVYGKITPKFSWFYLWTCVGKGCSWSFCVFSAHFTLSRQLRV